VIYKKIIRRAAADCFKIFNASSIFRNINSLLGLNRKVQPHSSRRINKNIQLHPAAGTRKLAVPKAKQYTNALIWFGYSDPAQANLGCSAPCST
jgi:hypothetical protein